MRIALLALLLSPAQEASADINWPVYSQQCANDAGPPYMDDEPGTYYHAGSAAYPVLNDTECAEPLKDACAQRPDFKTAYLEGPISCGNNGWYCRIFDDSANVWPTANLVPDLNFGQCNSVASFEDAGYDRDGHCHGSSDDSTYYWWIRDHWFRGYNGKVRCCCGWYEGGSQPLYGGRIANRCDYRRLVVDEQDASTCRDANEDHGLGFDDIGCDQQYRDQIGSPIPEDDSVCWEIGRFGFTEDSEGSADSADNAESEDIADMIADIEDMVADIADMIAGEEDSEDDEDSEDGEDSVDNAESEDIADMIADLSDMIADIADMIVDGEDSEDDEDRREDGEDSADSEDSPDSVDIATKSSSQTFLRGTQVLVCGYLLMMACNLIY